MCPPHPHPAWGFALSRPNASYQLHLCGGEIEATKCNPAADFGRRPPDNATPVFPTASNRLVVLSTAYPGPPIIQSHARVYVCLPHKQSLQDRREEQELSALSISQVRGNWKESRQFSPLIRVLPEWLTRQATGRCSVPGIPGPRGARRRAGLPTDAGRDNKATARLVPSLASVSPPRDWNQVRGARKYRGSDRWLRGQTSLNSTSALLLSNL